MAVERQIGRYNHETGQVEWTTTGRSEPRAEAPYVQDDTMPATYHHGVRQWFDSKSAFRAATKSIGCVEVGNEKLPPKERKVIPDKKIEKALREACDIHGYV